MITPHLVGRASQLAALHLLVEQAKRGEGHTLLISGEAGIGKSRLVAEVKAFTTPQGFLLLQGNCFPTDLNLSLCAAARPLALPHRVAPGSHTCD